MNRYLAITGGIGGAKLALGLARILPPEEILFVVNTGDDFEHLGLTICPDIDTLTYTLAELANRELGWGRGDESWNFLETLKALGGESWFRLGDRDLALNIVRTQLLASGRSLTAATDHLVARFGIPHRLVPMTDDPVRTTVHTPEGPLVFQHYFVRERCEPTVTGFEFQGIDDAAPNPVVLDWLRHCTGVIICPSNPYVSVDPLLNLPGMREALRASRAPVVAVSPIVGGAAIKGPTAKMMRELQVPATAVQIATHYGNLLDGFVLDRQDAASASELELPTVTAQSVMVTLRDRIELARAVLGFIDSLNARTATSNP